MIDMLSSTLRGVLNIFIIPAINDTISATDAVVAGIAMHWLFATIL